MNVAANPVHSINQPPMHISLQFTVFELTCDVVPIHVTMEEPHARIVGNKSDYCISKWINHPSISPHGDCRHGRLIPCET
jgi:hypothetical protein